MSEINGIVLKQNPIIQHNLVEIGKKVKERIALLELDKQVATEETLKTLKDIRADLNSEFKEFEEQRKFVKNTLLEPYNSMEIVYKNSITNEYSGAINLLKEKIDYVEDKLRDEKTNGLKQYFNDLGISENIDFVKFEQLGLNITLSATDKKLKEEIMNYVGRVKSDLALIDTQEHKAEILAEYKIDLNVSRAITTIADRKTRERLEQERLEQLKAEQERLEQLKAEQQQVQQHKVEETHLNAPVEVVEQVNFDPIVVAKFEVRGAKSKLLALRQFMIDNNYEYKNI